MPNENLRFQIGDTVRHVYSNNVLGRVIALFHADYNAGTEYESEYQLMALVWFDAGRIEFTRYNPHREVVNSTYYLPFEVSQLVKV